MTFYLEDFVRESNRIEGILRDPTRDEIDATRDFLCQPVLTVPIMCALVNVYAPGHRLRDQYGLDVRVGDHIAPRGSPEIKLALQTILDKAMHHHPSWQVHIEYETLHPFTDGNGRSGRALWYWQRGSAPLGFLHQFYYQTLDNADGRK